MIALALCLALTAAPAEQPRRLAVIVGSNSAVDGRPSLHYSHRDAKSIADVLITAGRFSPADVVVLLDPKPAEVLKALDDKLLVAKAAGPQSLLVFYYSGHADSRALFPGGEALPMDALKTRLASESAGLRVGIIDACRGGGWTTAKGLTPAEPFEVGLPQLSSEGTVLLAASSGLEDAHEAESLQGSFFTHHLVAGLRGAADTSHDAQVSLEEAFNYANKMTIRDTAMVAKEPQHPSFDMRLHGRQDIVLTDASTAPSVLTIAQKTGPLQIVQLSSGDVVVEAPAGENVFRLALPPGDYLVRKIDGAQVKVRQVTVAPDQKTSVDEASLELVGQPLLARKFAAPPITWTAGGAFAFVPNSNGFWQAYGFSAFASYRVITPLSLRLRYEYALVQESNLTSQLTRDFGVQPTALDPVPQWLAAFDASVIFYRYAGPKAGLSFEASFFLGPTAGSLMLLQQPSVGFTGKGPFIGLGFTSGVEAAITPVGHPELVGSLSFSFDRLWNDALHAWSFDNAVQYYKVGFAIAYRFNAG